MEGGDTSVEGGDTSADAPMHALTLRFRKSDARERQFRRMYNQQNLFRTRVRCILVLVQLHLVLVYALSY